VRPGLCDIFAAVSAVTASRPTVQANNSIANPEPKLHEGSVRLIGTRWSPRVHQIKDFLSRSRVPFLWLDIDLDEEARRAATAAVEGESKFPILIFPDGTVLQNPEVRDLAEKLGLDTEPPSHNWDIVIVGGGPAGITASIYGASEGLRTVVLDQTVPGGQASYSASIENYPGFPEGMSGSELASRAVRQAERFGAEVLVTRKAIGLRVDGDRIVVSLDDSGELESKAVLLTVGLSFRWLDAPGCAPLVGAGIYYGAVTAEAAACTGHDIYVLGGGNSAAQAALLLARYAKRVFILTLEDTLEETMSRYLVDRIRSTSNIVVKTNHTIVGAEGADHLERLSVQNLKTGGIDVVPAHSLFVFIGATPNTEWLPPSIERDDKGFVRSGFDFAIEHKRPVNWSLDRTPFMLETSVPGVFVAGDARSGSVKRLTAAVGEGAMAVHFIHRYCSTRKLAP
jgi:thioredoxin reductase (NADPH)